MDGLNTMTIQAKLLEHTFIFKKHSINVPPKVTVWLLSAVSFYLAQPPSVVSKCALWGQKSLPCVKGGGTACRDGGIVKTKKQSLSRLRRQLPLHKGASGSSRLFG